ncbi:MAG: sulfite exporter TauE/SafE family protein [Candidatus Ranarchaeia archaeon]
MTLQILSGILFTAFAVGVGVLSALLGLGGGFITTPVLIVIGLPPALVIGTVLAMILFTSVSSSLAYSRQKKICYKIGFLTAIPTIVGAVIGSVQSSIINTEFFKILFVICLFPIAIKMCFSHSKTCRVTENFGENNQEITSTLGKRELKTATLGFVSGLLSGFLGIGGGVIMVPVLLHVGRLSMHRAVATSTFIMMFTSLSGLMVKIAFNQIYMDLAVFLIIGITLGSQIGAHLCAKVSSNGLQQLFGLIMIITLSYLFLTTNVMSTVFGFTT